MESCGDRNCPIHGGLRVRGQVMEVKVVRDRMKNTIVVERDYLIKVPKYERYRRERSRIMVHIPPCMHVSRGEVIRVGECRKIAKNVNFVVLAKEGEKKSAGSRK